MDVTFADTARRARAVRTSYAAVAGLSLLGALAGCAPEPAPASADNIQSGAPAVQVTPATGAGGAAASNAGEKYKDGTYSADGHYVSPNGTETLGVQVTLSNDVVTDLKLTSHPSNPNTKKFQGEFIGGAPALVVGKDIDSLNVSKVAGSSLSSGGFNDALARIKAVAAK
ncbi:MAG: hypothetical protein JWO93_1712 [Micrococcaceae bacterium]|nr:hypothetical protein [Micrococcaceae bacterium]